MISSNDAHGTVYTEMRFGTDVHWKNGTPIAWNVQLLLAHHNDPHCFWADTSEISTNVLNTELQTQSVSVFCSDSSKFKLPEIFGCHDGSHLDLAEVKT